MKILLTGARGQISRELRRTLAPLGELVSCDRTTLDLSNPDSIRSAVRQVRPALVVNAAAYTAVDRAESEPELAMAINGIAPGILAEEAKRLGAAIVHYSTDYVFDGEKEGPYTEDDTPNPINVYGRTKLAGEQALMAVGAPFLIFRTSWIYGNRGHNFMLTIRRLAAERSELRVVSDQFGAPTWSRFVAEATALSIACTRAKIEDFGGIYHLACAGHASWCDFAAAIVHQMPAQGTLANVVGIRTTEYPTPARRPHNSVFSCERLKRRFGIELPPWEVGLALCLEER